MLSSMVDWRSRLAGVERGGEAGTCQVVVEDALLLEGVAQVFAQLFVVGHAAGGVGGGGGGCCWRGGVFGHGCVWSLLKDVVVVVDGGGGARSWGTLSVVFFASRNVVSNLY